MAQAATLNTIFTKHHGPASKICDFLCEAQLSEVSRVFQQANGHAMERVEARIALRDREAPRELERARSTLFRRPDQPLQEVVDEVEAGIRALEILVNPGRPAMFMALWIAMRPRVDRWVQDDRRDYLIVFLSTLKAKMRTVEENIGAPQPEAGGENPIEELVKCMDDFVCKDSLVERTLRIVAQPPLSRLGTLHASQKDAAAAHEDLIADFAQIDQRHTHSFALERFNSAEVVAREGQEFKDHALRGLWAGDLRPAIGEGPDVGASAAEIRAWMNDPANAQALARPVEFLNIGGYMPPEILKLTGLKHLRWDGRDLPLRALPEGFENLQRLEVVRLLGHRFSEVPTVLARLPALNINRFALLDNELPIRVLPEWLCDRHNFFTFSGFSGNENQIARIGQFLGILENDGAHSLQFFSYFGLPWQEITEIPFRVLLEENLRLPNIPVFCVILLDYIYNHFLEYVVGPGVAVPVDARGQAINQMDLGRKIEYPIWDCPFITIPFLTIYYALLIPLVLLGMAWESLTAPIQLFNYYLLSPFIMFIRDQLNYPRMVHVRDLPAQPALPAAPKM